ncbi:hypothetical protein GCM10022226_67520 [Sphaerisporangium flaviroseum]|uniref:DUF6817 domain-containing protein n=1 Tax=Sphaerisporangium flaviroseum TaxID=509199 RepID=A0ABP7J7R7_9ACTN
MRRTHDEPHEKGHEASYGKRSDESDNEAFDTAIELLRTLGAGEVDHPGGTLLAHLRRVHDLLAEWGARPDLRLAGLCHAFYGTDGFATALLPLDRRGELAAIIGKDAEALVHFYAGCDREASYPGLARDEGLFRDRFSGDTFSPPVSWRRDFAELTAANELDVVTASPELRARWGPGLRELLTELRPLLSDQAWRACERTLG